MGGDEVERALVVFLAHAPDDPEVSDRAIDLFLSRFDGEAERLAALDRLAVALMEHELAAHRPTRRSPLRRRG